MEQPREGIAWILLNIHQEVVIKEDTLDNDRRVLSCEIKIENQIYKLINIYCSNNNTERKQFILSIDRYLEIDRPTCNILNSEFICVLDKNIDRHPSRSYDKPGAKKLRDHILKCNLTDIRFTHLLSQSPLPFFLFQ